MYATYTLLRPAEEMPHRFVLSSVEEFNRRFAVSEIPEGRRFNMIEVVSNEQWLVAAAFGAAFVNDILLTSTLIYVLAKRRTGIKRSASTGMPSSSIPFTVVGVQHK